MNTAFEYIYTRVVFTKSSLIQNSLVVSNSIIEEPTPLTSAHTDLAGIRLAHRLTGKISPINSALGYNRLEKPRSTLPSHWPVFCRGRHLPIQEACQRVQCSQPKGALQVPQVPDEL